MQKGACFKCIHFPCQTQSPQRAGRRSQRQHGLSLKGPRADFAVKGGKNARASDFLPNESVIFAETPKRSVLELHRKEVPASPVARPQTRSVASRSRRAPMFHASLSTSAQPPPASPPECRPLSEQKVMKVGCPGARQRSAAEGQLPGCLTSQRTFQKAVINTCLGGKEASDLGVFCRL